MTFFFFKEKSNYPKETFYGASVIYILKKKKPKTQGKQNEKPWIHPLPIIPVEQEDVGRSRTLSPEPDHRSGCYCSRLTREHYRKEAFPGESSSLLQKCSFLNIFLKSPEPTWPFYLL